MKFGTRRRRRVHFYLNSQQKMTLILIGALYFGLIAGSLVIAYADQIDNVLIGYVQSMSVKAPVTHVLLNGFIINFLFFCALFLLGLSVLGYVFIPILPFIKGFSYGFSSAFLYEVFGVRGILVCALGILPQAFLSAVLLLIGCYFSVNKSRSFQRAGRYDIKRYCIAVLTLFVASFLLVVFDLLVTPNILQLFC